jgi:F420-dependent oxidoreductase-like protein
MELCAFIEPQAGASYEEQSAFARTAERVGFTGFFRSDHFLSMGGDGLPGPSDAWTTLAGIARDTEMIRLGTLVSSVTFRHPGLLAIQVANVDDMSSGRAELGLGAGWFQREHEAYGIPFPEKRFGMLEEQLGIVTGLWSTPIGRTFSHEGAHYSLVDSPALPKPVQDRVPVIVGGGGPRRTPALAARFATEYNYFGIARAPEQFAAVRAAAEEIDRDPDDLRLSIATTTIVGATDADVARRLRTIGMEPGSTSSEMTVGTVSAVVDRLGALRDDLGLARVYLQLLDIHDLDQLELIGSEVLPHLT